MSFGFVDRNERGPTSGMTAYGVSEAALTHLVRGLDLELRLTCVRVNAIAPQLIDTAKNHGFPNEDQLARAISLGSERHGDRLPRQLRRRTGRRSDSAGLRRLTPTATRQLSARPGF
ncbi:SDR family oxidoreductase [Streptomyces sp. NPDC088358]|uniref:SDR family oxidoreductase n=1 Tax=Streptomyces sp. NPDC088358 TaxID=3365857 RepID=UPI0038123107